MVKETSFRNSFYCNKSLDEHWNVVMTVFDVETAIELAEQEAEERMREKAVEAFKSECVFRDQRCKPDCKGCGKVKQFIQKLNEGWHKSVMQYMNGIGENTSGLSVVGQPQKESARQWAIHASKFAKQTSIAVGI